MRVLPAGLHHRPVIDRANRAKPVPRSSPKTGMTTRAEEGLINHAFTCNAIPAQLTTYSCIQRFHAFPGHSPISGTTIIVHRPSNASSKQNAQHGNAHHRLRPPLISMPPTIPAATATPPMIATPIRPSLDTLSSISCRRLPACRFPGSLSRSKSLYRLASA